MTAFTDAIEEAMSASLRMKAEGRPQHEIDAYVEAVMQTALPGVRMPADYPLYRCGRCEDTGWVMVQEPARLYGGALVNRAKRCTCWELEQARREAANPRPDFADAGNTSKPMTRLGRKG